MSADPIDAWIPNSITGAYFKVTLRQVFNIHGVTLKQNYNKIKEIKLTLANNTDDTLVENVSLNIFNLEKEYGSCENNAVYIPPMGCICKSTYTDNYPNWLI